MNRKVRKAIASWAVGSAALLLLWGCTTPLPTTARIESASPTELDTIEADLRQRSGEGDRYPRLVSLLARILSQQGKWSEAAALATEASQLAPFDAKTLELLGNIQQRAGRNFQALLAYNQAIALDAELLSAYVGLAHVQRQLGDDKAAINALRKALLIEPRYYNARYLLADLLYLTGEYASAEKAIVRARRVRPVEESAILLHVRILKSLGRLNEARLLADRTLAADGENSALWRELLDIHFQRLEWDKVEQVLARLALLGHPEPQDFLIRIEMLAARGEGELSEQELSELLRRFPRFVPGLIFKGRRLIETNQPRQAMDPLKAAVEISPREPIGHYWLSIAYFILGQDLRGDLALNRALQLDPGNRGARLLQVRRLLAKRNTRKASIFLGKYLKEFPFDQEALLLLATVQTLGNQFSAAEKTLAKLPVNKFSVRFARARLSYLQKQYRNVLLDTQPLLDDPNPHWEAAYLQGAALGALGRYAEATQLLTAYLDGNQDTDAFYRLVGDLYSRAGDRQAAKKAYVAGLRVFPRHPGLLDGVSRLAVEMERWNEARDWLEAAVERPSPLLAVFLERLGAVYGALGETQKRQETLRRYLTETDPLLREGNGNGESAILYRMSFSPLDSDLHLLR